jgi:hypothetical protein
MPGAANGFGGNGGFIFVLATHKTGSTFLWRVRVCVCVSKRSFDVSREWQVTKGLAMLSGTCFLDAEAPAGIPDTAEATPPHLLESFRLLLFSSSS